MVVDLPVPLIFPNISTTPSIESPCILSYTGISCPSKQFTGQTAESIVCLRHDDKRYCGFSSSVMLCRVWSPPKRKPADPEYVSQDSFLISGFLSFLLLATLSSSFLTPHLYLLPSLLCLSPQLQGLGFSSALKVLSNVDCGAGSMSEGQP